MTRPNVPSTLALMQLRPLALALDQLGIDARRVFGRVGLRVEDLSDDKARMASGVEFELWDVICELAGDPFIALRLADQMAPGALGAYEYVIRNSPNLRAAIELAGRYVRLVDDLLRVELVRERDSAGVRVGRDGGYPIPARGIECTFAVIVRIVSEHPDFVARPYCMQFAHAAGGDPLEYARRFGCPVQFSQPHNQLLFAPELLDIPNPSADPRLREVLEAHVQGMLAALPNEDPFVHRARLLVASSLADGSASLESLADALHVSTRTLRRRFELHGTSYKDLLDAVRKELGCYYVARTEESFDRIAQRLGFSEPSTFYRAFKRWSGTTPALYRSARPSSS